jgi:hypothetical protein
MGFRILVQQENIQVVVRLMSTIVQQKSNAVLSQSSGHTHSQQQNNRSQISSKAR